LSKHKKLKEVVCTALIAIIVVLFSITSLTCSQKLIDDCGGAGGILVKVGRAIESAGKNLQ